MLEKSNYKFLKLYKMYGKFQQHLKDELAAIDAAGLYKRERNIASQQFAEITLEDGSKALNFCANNYLGLSNQNSRADHRHRRSDGRKGTDAYTRDEDRC